jgi:opacity protein-like surface antigen
MLRLVILAALASTASAQTRYPNEIHAHAGGGWTYDDEGSIGTGVSVAANVARRLTTKVAVEGELSYFRHKRDLSFAIWKGTGAFATGNLLYHFSSSRVQPYVLAGIGLMIYKPDFSVETDSSAGWAWGFGFGVKGFVTERISIRPEWRVYVGHPQRNNGPEPPISHSRITVGLGYRW